MNRDTENEARALEAHTFEEQGVYYALFALDAPQPTIPKGLTPAETELVQCILRGMSHAQIAESRGRSRHTVSNQLRGIYRKLGVDGRNGLIAHCVRRR